MSQETCEVGGGCANEKSNDQGLDPNHAWEENFHGIPFLLLLDILSKATMQP